MIDRDIKDGIIHMFLGGAEVGQILASFPDVGKTTIYNLRSRARAIAEAQQVAVPELPPIGVIADTHLPFVHPRYFDFIRDTFISAGVHEVVHIGDWFDNHAMSFHETDPDGMSAGDELRKAQDEAERWYEAFPTVTWVAGNHDNLPMRRVRAAGLTKAVLQKNITGAPAGWINRTHVIKRDVRFSHGIGSAGVLGHLNLSKAKGMSVVMGHCHSFGGVAYRANENDLFAAMNVGCGIDIESYAMQYGKDFPQRPTMGCGLVYSSSYMVFVPMDMRRYSRHSK